MMAAGVVVTGPAVLGGGVAIGANAVLVKEVDMTAPGARRFHRSGMQ